MCQHAEAECDFLKWLDRENRKRPAMVVNITPNDTSKRAVAALDEIDVKPPKQPWRRR